LQSTGAAFFSGKSGILSETVSSQQTNSLSQTTNRPSAQCPTTGGHGAHFTETEQALIFLSHRFGAHREPGVKSAHVDVGPGRPHDLMRLNAHRAVFGNGSSVPVKPFPARDLLGEINGLRIHDVGSFD
jgi:hypothetical protein